MNTNLNPAERIINWFSSSVTLRIFFIAFLALLLLIPSGMITSMIREREATQEGAVEEISNAWAGSQEISGPILTLSYVYLVKDDEGREEEITQYLNLMPESLIINAKLFPEKRYRGIYETVVYNARIRLSGSFLIPPVSDQLRQHERLSNLSASVIIGIPDLRGIQENVRIKWGDSLLEFEPGTINNDVVATGISALIRNLESSELAVEVPFSVDLNLNGSRQLYFTPTGKTTAVEISSLWPDPSFAGAFLPDERQISDTGFTASWEVFHLNRNFPQQWTGNAYHISESAFGVELLQPADAYQKAYRSVRYALLIISLTFLVFFFTELRGGFRINPLQYILVGLGLVLFYSLLLSLAEHLGFDLAYAISGVAIIALISVYSLSIFKHRSGSLLLFLILALLYLFLYILLRMNDYALLIGNIALFVILAVVMYISSRMRQY